MLATKQFALYLSLTFFFFCSGFMYLSAAPTATQSATSTKATLSPTATPTRCPIATFEPLWVEPVTSPTDQLTQTITIRIGNGEAVTVTAESGLFALTGDFDAYNNPAEVEINLLPDTTHHLSVKARVEEREQGGCPFGGYVLSTTQDRFSNPLLIMQQSSSTLTATPTTTPTATETQKPTVLYLPIIKK